MSNDKGIEKTPAEERARIGTPAGESPEMGRQRHGTNLMHEEMPDEPVLIPKKTIEEDSLDDDFGVSGEEISATGGTTGTHVHGGVPPGGKFSGGTLAAPIKWHSGDYKA